MAGEIGGRSFPEDIFAEDNEKWQWNSVCSSKASVSGPVYGATASTAKIESSSEDDLTYPSDSNSLKRTFRRRETSSGSEENLREDTSYSPKPRNLSHERAPPSIYDDDAQSGNPSGNYEHRNLAFMPFRNELFNTELNKNKEISPLHSSSALKYDKHMEQMILDKSKKNTSPSYDSKKHFSGNSSKTPPLRRSQNSRSGSYERISQRSRSRSQSKEFHAKSPSRERRIDNKPHRSRSRDRSQPIKGRRSRSPVSHRRSHSRDSKRRSQSRDSHKRSRSNDSPSKDTHRRSHSRDSRKRSHSRDSRKRSHSRDSRKRSHSRDTRRRSRSRNSRRRSPSYERRRRDHYRNSSRDRYRRRRYSRSRSRSRGRSGSGLRKPGSLPLSTSGGAMTPQMALQQTMAAMSAKAQAMTGIALPKYYNPAAVNPLKYAEQVQKRKLLWQTKEKEEEQPKNTVWDKLKFAQDQDGKMTAKFRKLMGIKSEGQEIKNPEEDKESVLKRQEELFRDLDQQYEMARMTTHTQRGVGLGYSAQPLYPPVPK